MIRATIMAVVCLAALAGPAALLGLPSPASQFVFAQPRQTPIVPDLEVPGPAWQSTSPRRMASFGAAVVAALLLLLYAFRRQRYILHWTFAWMFQSTSLLLVATEYGSRAVAQAMLGLSHFLGIASALLFVVSADTYRKRPSLDPRYVWGLLPLLIWFALAPIVLGSRSVVVPGYLVSAGVLVTAGTSYLVVLRNARFVGAGLLGTTLLLLALSYAWIGIAISRGGTATLVPTELLVINALLYLFGALGMHLLVFEDMTYELRVTNRRLAAAQSELRQLVITDPLTGCHNRRFFEEIIGRERRRHRRYAIPLSVLFIDIDRFKAINDALGHEAGDRVLQRVAAFLKRNVREADYVFRWGGDEFLIVISCTLQEALHKSEELKTAFRTAPEALDLPKGVGLSVGCAEMSSDDTDVLSFIREADMRMYEDKMGPGTIR